MKILIIAAVVVVAAGGVIVLATQHRHNENCKWIAPLRTEYVMCSDGKVRHK